MTSRARGDWLRRFHPNPDAAARLVCFPHAGGSANYYFPVSRALSPTADVVCVQYPGRQDRRLEPCLDTIDELADRAAHALRPGTDLPTVFFGHSMGAVVAYEVALRLAVDGVRLTGLFVSGRRAPCTTRVETVHLGGEAGILAELRRLEGTESSLLGDPELLEMIMPALRGDYRAIETYGPRSGLVDCPVVALIGDRDPKVTAGEADAWREHTGGAFRLHSFPGGHFYLNDHAATVITMLGDHLAGARVAAV